MMKKIKLHFSMFLILCIVFSNIVFANADSNMVDVAIGRKVTSLSPSALQYNYGHNGGWAYSGNQDDASCLTNGSYYTANGLYSNVMPVFKIDLGNALEITDIHFKNIDTINQFFASKPASLLGLEVWATNNPNATWSSVKNDGVKLTVVSVNESGPQSWWKASDDGGILDDAKYRYIFFGRDVGDYDNDGSSDNFEISGVKIFSETQNVFGNLVVKRDGNEVTSLTDSSGGSFVATVPVYNYSTEADAEYVLIVAAYDDNGKILALDVSNQLVRANTVYGASPCTSTPLIAPEGTSRIWATLISDTTNAVTYVDSMEIKLN